jgi:hypothetical protein
VSGGPQGASEKGLMCSSSSIAQSLSSSAALDSGERNCLMDFSMRGVLWLSGLISCTLWLFGLDLMIFPMVDLALRRYRPLLPVRWLPWWDMS